jgi:hypothetical protein
MKRPETPDFASKKSIHLDLSKSRIFSFIESCTPVIKNQSLFNFTSKRHPTRQDPTSEKIKKAAENLSVKIIESFKIMFPQSHEKETLEFQSKVATIVEEFFRNSEISSIFSNKPEELDENFKILANQIEKITSWRFFQCETFSKFSSILLKKLESSTKKTLKSEELVKDLQKKLKELKKSIKNLFEQLKISDFPEGVKKV